MSLENPPLLSDYLANENHHEFPKTPEKTSLSSHLSASFCLTSLRDAVRSIDSNFTSADVPSQASF